MRFQELVAESESKRSWRRHFRASFLLPSSSTVLLQDLASMTSRFHQMPSHRSHHGRPCLLIQLELIIEVRASDRAFALHVNVCCGSQEESERAIHSLLQRCEQGLKAVKVSYPSLLRILVALANACVIVEGSAEAFRRYAMSSRLPAVNSRETPPERAQSKETVTIPSTLRTYQDRAEDVGHSALCPQAVMGASLTSTNSSTSVFS